MCDLGIDMVTRFRNNVNLYRLTEQISEKRRGRSKQYGEAIKAKDLMMDGRRKLTCIKVHLYVIKAVMEYKTAILKAVFLTEYRYELLFVITLQM